MGWAVFCSIVPYNNSHPVPVPLNKEMLDATRAKEKEEAELARREAQLQSLGHGGSSSFMTTKGGAGSKPPMGKKDDPKTAKLRGLLGRK